MTEHKHLKHLIRARMAKTGERYAAARRHVLERPGTPPTPPGVLFHRPGNIPATTALRALLTAAGLSNPFDGRPYSEAMLFGIGGGIGIGVFSFLYERADFASFFVGGRHLWQDDDAYLRRAFERLGVKIEVHETSAAGVADRTLRAVLASGRPAIAFVEAGLLPHRAMPRAMLGGGYHVVSVHAIDDGAGAVLVGDLADDPIAVPLADFAAARGRIKKFKHRLIAVTGSAGPRDLSAAVRNGLAACHRGLFGDGAIGGSKRNFSIEALAELAARIGGEGKQSWAKVYPAGGRLWNALTMMYEFIELHGTGGGLCRPMFSAFLGEAGAVLRDPALAALGEGYSALGDAWTDLAHAALPDGVPLLRQAREAMTERAELRAGRIDRDAIRAIDAAGARLGTLAAEATARFPLSETAIADLRRDLQQRVADIHRQEAALAAELGRIVGKAA